MSTEVQTDRLSKWIIRHDDCKIFIILYIGLAVVLSLIISLFWLVFVVLIHFILEIIRQKYLNNSYLNTILVAVWEVKLDIALVLFALWLGVYMDLVFGIAGIGVGARSAAQIGSRFAVWQRVIRGVLISMDDIAQILRFSIKTKKGLNKSDQPLVSEEIIKKTNPWKNRWSVGDWFSISFGIIMLFLLLIAPYITVHSYNDVSNILAGELHPWPF